MLKLCITAGVLTITNFPPELCPAQGIKMVSLRKGHLKIILLYTALHCTALHCTALYSTALHCTAMHCTVQHCTALHCTALHWLYCKPIIEGKQAYQSPIDFCRIKNCLPIVLTERVWVFLCIIMACYGSYVLTGICKCFILLVYISFFLCRLASNYAREAVSFGWRLDSWPGMGPCTQTLLTWLDYS